jgi:hypothetical protein
MKEIKKKEREEAYSRWGEKGEKKKKKKNVMTSTSVSVTHGRAQVFHVPVATPDIRPGESIAQIIQSLSTLEELADKIFNT